MEIGWPSYRLIVRLRSSDVNRGDLAATGSEIDRSIILFRTGGGTRDGRLPGGWHGESLGAAREHHARTLTSRVFTQAIVAGEDRRLESDRFYER